LASLPLILQRYRSLIVKAVFFSSLVLVWHVLAAVAIQEKWVKEFLCPTPMAVVQSFKAIYETGEWRGILESLKRMSAGYSISVVAGLLLGVAAARSWLFKETVGSVVLSLQSLPSVLWMPFALLWIGFDDRAVLAVVILGAMFSIAISTENAIRNVPPIYFRVGRVLGARGWRYHFQITFMAALPELIGGLKVGWTFAWRSLMAAELIRPDNLGVGRILDTGRQFNDVAMMVATLIIILAIGLIVDALVFGRLETFVRRRYGLERR
jgi:NitT/TauT family transport system permease protein